MIQAISEYLRFYELALVKKFFLRNILNDLANSIYKKLNEFKNIREELNKLEVSYNAMLIFKSEGSPKEMYNKLLEKTGTNKTVEVVSKFLKNTTDYFIDKRERKIKELDMYITILTSFLALLFGFGGLKSFVDNALIHIKFLDIGYFISAHLYSFIFILWAILFATLLLFNILKFRSYKK